jgi:hypothetical protein
MSTVTPSMREGGNTSAQTANPGTTFVAFPAQTCRQLTVVNNTGQDIEVQQSGAGTALPVLNGTTYTFFGIPDAAYLAVRRIDQSNTQVVVKARWEH